MSTPTGSASLTVTDVHTPLSDEERDAMIRQTFAMTCDIHADIAATRELVEKVMTEIQPTIEAFTSSPMGRMLMKGLGS